MRDFDLKPRCCVVDIDAVADPRKNLSWLCWFNRGHDGPCSWEKKA